MSTTYYHSYTPEALLPIPRSQGRSALNAGPLKSMRGSDTWQCFELTWLSPSGYPCCGIFTFSYQHDSPCIVESKSIKLYLMSFASERFENQEALLAVIINDLEKCVGSELLNPTIHELQGTKDDGYLYQIEAPRGTCIDNPSVEVSTHQYTAEVLEILEPGNCEQRYYSHALRSLCPVTDQPDFGTMELHFIGPKLCPESLARYIASLRNHKGYHEQCAELIFSDLVELLNPEQLVLRLTYTRRGGIDISPLRHTPDCSLLLPLQRMVRH